MTGTAFRRVPTGWIPVGAVVVGMEYRETYRESETRNLIEELEQLRRFDGPPAEFWPSFLEKAGLLVAARLALLLAPGDDDTSWKHLGLWPDRSRGLIKVPELAIRIEEVARESLAERSAWTTNGQLPAALGAASLVGVRLGVDEGRYAVAVVLLADASETRAEEASVRLNLIADTPSVYQLGRLLGQAKEDVGKFSDGLDLLVLLNEKKRYVAAAMTFANEVASRYRCDRVSLGWLKGGYVRIQAISHIERFEKKMDVVQDLESVMEESLDQDEEILWPRPAESTAITRNHESFSKREGSGNLVSLPIRLDDAPIGVLTCERSREPFSESAVRSLRLLCDLAARRLGDLKDHDRWVGARMAAAAREGAARLVGVEHTFAKLAGILVAGLLAFGIFGRLDYRVEAPFVLKSDDVAYLSAPFDGYIDQVLVDVGDFVEPGDLLLSFDTREFLLEEATAIANQIRFEREEERARAERAVADMMVAEALADQAGAQLGLVRHYLGQSEVRAAFSGIVVEGDLKELRGTPSRKGDVLFKIARTENLYAELEIDERDAHEVSDSASGEVSFLSRPDLTFPITVERTDPVAVTEDEQNVFIARADFTLEAAPWWRPGMSGVAKVDIGRRNVLWILTHRTIDFLRIFFWW